MQITWTTLPYIYFNFCIYFVLSLSKLWNKNDTQDFYFIYSELALITNQFTLLFYIYGGFFINDPMALWIERYLLQFIRERLLWSFLIEF